MPNSISNNSVPLLPPAVAAPPSRSQGLTEFAETLRGLNPTRPEPIADNRSLDEAPKEQELTTRNDENPHESEDEVIQREDGIAGTDHQASDSDDPVSSADGQEGDTVEISESGDSAQNGEDTPDDAGTASPTVNTAKTDEQLPQLVAANPSSESEEGSAAQVKTYGSLTAKTATSAEVDPGSATASTVDHAAVAADAEEKLATPPSAIASADAGTAAAIKEAAEEQHSTESGATSSSSQGSVDETELQTEPATVDHKTSEGQSEELGAHQLAKAEQESAETKGETSLPKQASGSSTSIDTLQPARVETSFEELSEGEPLESSMPDHAVKASGTESSVANDTAQPPAPTSSHSLLQQRISTEAAGAATSPEAPTEPAPRVDASRFLGRVTRAFQAAEQRGGTIQLRLSPPELGAMKIELSVQQGTLTAKLETETAAAKNVLLDNLPALRERLAAQEIRVEKFDVDVQQQGSEAQPDWQAGERGRDARQRSSHQGNNPPAASSAQTASTVSPNVQTDNHDGQLNIVA